MISSIGILSFRRITFADSGINFHVSDWPLNLSEFTFTLRLLSRVQPDILWVAHHHLAPPENSWEINAPVLGSAPGRNSNITQKFNKCNYGDGVGCAHVDPQPNLCNWAFPFSTLTASSLSSLLFQGWKDRSIKRRPPTGKHESNVRVVFAAFHRKKKSGCAQCSVATSAEIKPLCETYWCGVQRCEVIIIICSSSWGEPCFWYK